MLLDSRSPLYGNVHCTTTADGQFTAELTAASTLFISGRANPAEPDTCHVADNCISSSTVYCIQPEKIDYNASTRRLVLDRFTVALLYSGRRC
jgi:hypothetical protein